MKSAHRFVGLMALLCLLVFQNCSPKTFTEAQEVASQGVPQEPTPTTLPPVTVLKTLEPTLAVRAMGCVQCHAKVASNIVTDFGFGNDYYFGGSRYFTNATPYGDHAQQFGTMDLSASQTFYVPAARAPASVEQATGATTLAEYVSNEFKKSSNPGTKAIPVKELKSIYIGAPTDSDLISAFSLGTTARSKFIKTKLNRELSGLEDKGEMFKNNGPLVCDGDLVVRGPLHLDNLQLDSKEGCRLYVIGSVFIYGPIQYLNLTPTSNLQITSSRTISLGLGMAKRADGSYCDKNDRWAENPGQGDSSYSRGSSLLTRFKDMFNTEFNRVRSYASASAYGDDVVADLKKVESSQGILLDAVCRPEGRNVSFERLLLNAPTVHSRYIGDFKGTIIAEYALMSLNQFKFEFDPVFRSVDVLPQLDRSKYLHE